MSAAAHEFWLQPDTYQPKPNQVVTFDINVGMNFAGDLWKGDLKNIIQLPMISGDSNESLIPEGGLTEPVFKKKFTEAGQYLIGLANENSFIELSAEKFEKYVISEGLEHIVAERKKLGESDKMGRELYRRCAKVLVQQGSADDSTYSKSLGFPVELIALDNPYQSDVEHLKFRLNVNGEPSAGAKIMIWQKDGDKLNRKELITNKSGEVQFLVKPEGIWMVSTVHMERVKDDDKADWQSYWASYTFGYK